MQPEAILQTQPYFFLFQPQTNVIIGNIFAQAERIDADNSLAPFEKAHIMEMSFQQLTQIKGIEIKERRNWSNDYAFRCVEFAIEGGSGKYESEIWSNTDRYLAEFGFQPVIDEPTDGDIIIYKTFREGQFYTKHIGRYLGIKEGKARVLSKFGQGYVLEHDINVISPAYGDWVYFYRKIAESTEC